MKKRNIFKRIRTLVYERDHSVWLKKTISTNKLKTYVEIGVWTGETSYKIAINCPSLKEICLVDPYSANEKYNSGHTNNDKSKLYEKNETYIVNNAKAIAHNLLSWDKRVRWYNMTSLKASKKIKDNSIDLVFIDGLHDYNNVKLDIELWIKKVKKGGIISGHDYHYNRLGVVKAVQESFKNINLEDGSVWWVRK